MAFDYKKEFKFLYQPKTAPGIITVPKMNFTAVRGRGDPNAADGEYKQAVGLLYGIAYTVKMSKMGTHRIEGYFDHVVPPLEGFWRQEGPSAFDPSRKEDLEWISVIRLPDFVTKDDFEWALEEAARKKQADFSKAFFFPFEEGLCVQCLHTGPYDEEPRTIAAMHAFIRDRGYALDLTERRPHHEIYLSDPNKTAPDKLKTVIRLPIRKV